LIESASPYLPAAESLAEKIFEQKICSPHRDERRRNSWQPSSLSPKHRRGMRSAIASRQRAGIREIKMRKTILTVAGSALIAMSAMQMASAAEHRSHKADRAAVSTNEQFRNSNAAWSTAVQPDWSRYNGGMSAPAGR
jgi:hypothetical protein